MYITGCNKHLAQFFSKLCHLQIDSFQILIALNIREFITPYKKFIIADWLYLQIVIKACNAHQFFIALSGNNGTYKLPRLTGRTNDNAFPVLGNNLARQSWLLIQIPQMCQGNHTIKITQSDRIFSEQYNMICPFLLIVIANQIPFNTIDDFYIQLFFLYCLCRIRKSLDDAMIRDCNSRPAPTGSCLNQFLYRNYGIHTAHMRMCMQLNSFFFRCILTLCCTGPGYPIHRQNEIILKGIKAGSALDLHCHASLEYRLHPLKFFFLLVLKEDFAADAIRIIRQIK